MAGASEAEVDALVCPAQSYPLNTRDERAKHHDRLVARGFAANAAGDTKHAAELFEEAHALVRTRASTLLSLLNMRLKLGQCELAAAGYLRLMESFELAPREWVMAREKLRLANEGIVRSRRRDGAATEVQRC